MHFLGFGSHPYPEMPFGSARTQDMGVTWAELQPRGSWWNSDALARLDSIVNTFKSHGVQPLIVLGQTPNWARDNCNYGSWPSSTCGPRSTGLHSPWAGYVRGLANRYHHVFFEVWNEPNLKNGYNDSTAKLARLQATAYTVIHNAKTGDRLVSPTVAVTAGNPFGWLRTFFRSKGGKRFDVFGIHLYPSDKSARQGVGPEWSVQALAQVRSMLRANSIRKPIWDTEANVGRYPERHTTSRTFTRWAAAAMVSRLYVLQLSNHAQRIFWYAADDRTYTGTWMEKSDYKSLTYAGRAERTAFDLLVGARVHGCSHTSTGHYTCKFHLANGKNMLVVWTTHGHYYWRSPHRANETINAIGGSKRVKGGSFLKITTTPRYVVGSFSL